MEQLLLGLTSILNPHTLFVMALSIIGGIVIGTLPGLSSVMAISLMLPVAYGLGPITGLSMLGAIYTAALYGGANSAILLNTPGTPSSLPTTFDGFPLTQQGKADSALYGALYASVFGGLFGTLILIVAFEPLAEVSLKFGPPEFLSLTILGLCAIVAISEGQIIKGFMSACVGLMIAMMGTNPVTSDVRFTFGFQDLIAGVGIIPALLGLFSLSQTLKMIDMKSDYIAEYKKEEKVMSRVFNKAWSTISLLSRSSFVGSLIGILPGAGGAIASIIAYNEAKRSSKHPEKFGKGAIEGLFASESANNAQVSSSLVPMMGLGIPGNVNAAIIMGALMSFGIQPGIGLLKNSGDIAYSFMASLIVANVLLLVIGVYMVKMISKVLLIPNSFLCPTIIVLCIIGAYASTHSMLGVWIMFVTGLIGFFSVKSNIPIGPMALGMVLGPIAEKGLLQSIQLSKSEPNLLYFILSRPITLVLLLLSFLSLLAAVYVEKKTKQTQKEVEESRSHE